MSRLALVLEDDLSTRVLLLLILSRIPGVSVLTASSVQEGKALARACKFDIAVLDLVLGDGTGFDVLEELRQTHAPECVVLASAYIDKFRHSVRIESNIVLIEKPIVTEQLVNAIETLRTAPTGDEPLFDFTVPEYLQIACMGLHSVRLEIVQDEERVGSITIRDGQLWSARDAKNVGEQAFRRLIALEGARVVCRAPNEIANERDINRNWQNVLLDAARLSDEDEREASREARVDDDAFMDFMVDDTEDATQQATPAPASAPEAPASERAARASPPASPASAPPAPTRAPATGDSAAKNRRELVESLVDVSEMIERAAKAVRASRFEEAYAAYSEVLAANPRHSIARINVSRLERLGFGGQREAR